jgi:hypothetical protein
MPRVATVVPADTDLLCEFCGYTLNGLPDTGNCPECGQPIRDSGGSTRHLAAFEAHPSLRTFLQTTGAALFRPGAFFRGLATRQTSAAASWFSRTHRGLAALLFSMAVSGHFVVQQAIAFRATRWDEPDLFAMLLTPVALVIYLVMTLLTRFAAWLTTVEATYRGIRLPSAVVNRGLGFHYVHYVPVAVVAATLVCGYLIGVHYGYLDPWTTTRAYLYTLSGAVVLGSGYLFLTYWIVMKNMMYANR